VVPTAAAFVGGGDWSPSTSLRDASERCHAPDAHNTGTSKAITADDVRRLLDSCDLSDPVGVVTTQHSCWSHAWARDRSPAARLQVDDLDWRTGRSVLQRRASREDGTALPADVGEALSAYLRQARPATGELPSVSAAVPVRPTADSRAASELSCGGWKMCQEQPHRGQRSTARVQGRVPA
jgi:integrase